MSRYVTPETFRFFSELARHNDRAWFEANKARYLEQVRDPLLRFVEAFGPGLARISRHMVADPRPAGGSLFRIYRDTRFSADKSPYKTHVGIYFPHKQAGRDVHAPCFYLHLEPGDCFAGGGLWHPDAPALRTVRTAIVEWSDAWRLVRRAGLLEEGDALKSPPRGYDAAHPFIDDLKLKDFVSSTPLTESRVCSPQLIEEFADVCRRMRPLIRFLTEALGLPF